MASPITFIFNLLACSDSAETTEATQTAENTTNDEPEQVASSNAQVSTYERIPSGAARSLR